jgi:hypothetical protein
VPHDGDENNEYGYGNFCEAIRSVQNGVKLMLIAAIASVAAPIIGGVMASNAAQNAANTQAKSADKATALQKEMWQKNLELQQPFDPARV